MVAVKSALAVRVAVLALPVSLGLSVELSAAQFLEFYKLGITAAESSNWTQAADMMQRAIELQPEPKVRVKRSLYFRRYLPYYHLGRARFELGDCQGALAAWRQSVSQEVVTRFPEFEQLKQERQVCRQRLADLEFARKETREVIDRAESVAAISRRRLEELAREGVATAGLSERQIAAETALGRARARLEAGDVELPEIEQAAARAAEAREEFESIRRAAEGQQEALISKKRQLAEELERLVQHARRALTNTEYLRPYPSGIAGHRAEVERLLEIVDGLQGEPTVTEVEVLLGGLETATRGLQASSAPPPEELVVGAQAFLAGNYARVLGVLSDYESPSAKAESHALLLQAAALFGLFQATGASDPALLESAKEKVHACRLADPSPVPSSEVFSPRFIAFFEAQGAREEADKTRQATPSR